MMQKRFVNIITSDRGWILEKMARELSENLNYVDYTGVQNDDALINYYFTYGCFRKKSPRLDLAWFTHIEQVPETKQKFFDVAHQVDYCLTQAKLYEDALLADGIERVETIPPGVDLEAFSPKVRIGVVGRTYHTGRKGEALVAQMMDIPGLEWRFTGAGWPGEARFIPGDKMPDFYNDLDYVLVPSYFEGGPMCVIEALACGVPVIAPPIGWVSDYPHIEYETGNPESLRKVLLELVDERNKLRKSVESAGWDRWYEGHDRLFRRLFAEIGESLPQRYVNIVKPLKTVLALHGDENVSQGGPSRRVPRLASELTKRGHQAELRFANDRSLVDADVVHGFNIWNPATSLRLAQRAKMAGKPYVFSPILLDFSETSLWNRRLPQLGSASKSLDEFVERTDSVPPSASDGPFVEPFPGFKRIAQEIINQADHLVYLSQHERDLTTKMVGRKVPGSLVYNPVDAALFSQGDAKAFESEFGMSDFLLVTARIERRKNQLMLLAALKDVDIPVVLAGHAGDAEYAATIRRFAGPNVHMIGRLNSAQAVSDALAAASVFALPSFSEGAPLAALEAGAAGISMVLSDRSSEREYFGDNARYCDPASIDSLRDTIIDAWDNRHDHDRDALKQFTAENFSWDRHVRETAKVYSSVRSKKAGTHRAGKQIDACAEKPIYFDVTTSAGRKGRWTGISRSEMSLAISSMVQTDREIRFVVWNNERGHFFEVSPEIVGKAEVAAHVRSLRNQTEPIELAPEGDFLVLGSGWMQNPRYCAGACQFARSHQLNLNILVHDIIPLKFPHWFEDGYEPVFRKNFEKLMSHADRILANSQNTKRDIEEFTTDIGLPIGPVAVVRLGDDSVGLVDDPSENAARTFSEWSWLLEERFILNVGAIHARKNQALLYDVWRSLVREMGDKCPHLVIVGGTAWLGDHLARAFNSDPEVKDRIHILSDVDDYFLRRLYENCEFTVYPSLYEGWGLPITESLKAGKHCLTSNRSSMVEVAPKFTELLDPESKDEWFHAVRRILDDRQTLEDREKRIRSYFRARPWSETARQVLACLEQPMQSVRNGLSIGMVVDCKEGTNVEHVGFEGAVQDKQGMVATGSSFVLRLDCDLPPEEDIKLCIAWEPGNAIARGERIIYVNGHKVGSFRQPYGGVFPTVFRVEASQLRSDGVQSIRIVGEGSLDNLVLRKAMLANCDDILDLGPICRLDPKGAFFGLSQVRELASDTERQMILQDAPNKLAMNLLQECPDETAITAWFGEIDEALAASLEITVDGEQQDLDIVSSSSGTRATFVLPKERLNKIPLHLEATSTHHKDDVGIPIEAAASHYPGDVPIRRQAVSNGSAEPLIHTAKSKLELGELLTGRRLSPEFAPAQFSGAWADLERLGDTATATFSLAHSPGILERMKSRYLVMLTGEFDGPDDVGSILVHNGVGASEAKIENGRFRAVFPVPSKAIRKDGQLALRFLATHPGLFSLSKFRIMKLPKNDFDAHALKGDFFRDVGLWPEAAAAYTNAMDSDYSAHDTAWVAAISVQLGHALKESDDFRGAKRAYVVAQNLDGTDPDIYLQIGHLYNHMKKVSEARIYYQKARDLAPNDEEILRHLAEIQ